MILFHLLSPLASSPSNLNNSNSITRITFFANPFDFDPSNFAAFDNWYGILIQEYITYDPTVAVGTIVKSYNTRPSQAWRCTLIYYIISCYTFGTLSSSSRGRRGVTNAFLMEQPSVRLHTCQARFDQRRRPPKHLLPRGRFPRFTEKCSGDSQHFLNHRNADLCIRKSNEWLNPKPSIPASVQKASKPRGCTQNHHSSQHEAYRRCLDYIHLHSWSSHCLGYITASGWTGDNMCTCGVHFPTKASVISHPNANLHCSGKTFHSIFRVLVSGI